MYSTKNNLCIIGRRLLSWEMVPELFLADCQAIKGRLIGDARKSASQQIGFTFSLV